MKKITLSITALSIAVSGFSIDPPTKLELIQEISMTTEDIIESMREINASDSTISKEISEIYVHNLLSILSKTEDLQALDCENCDEID
jgi:hypothetical protein